MPSKNRFITVAIVVLVVLLLLLWPSGRTGIGDQFISQNIPDEWTEIGLPILPGTEFLNVTDISDEETEIEFSVEMDPDEVGGFFEQELGQRDFEFEDETSASGQYWNDFFGDDGLGISIVVVPDPDVENRSRVKIGIGREISGTSEAPPILLIAD